MRVCGEQDECHFVEKGLSALPTLAVPDACQSGESAPRAASCSASARARARLIAASEDPASSPGGAHVASIEVRRALVEKRGHALTGVRCLARGGHELDGVGVGLGLVEIDLGVEPVL